jgi:MYXO-CTERM domain-containing protein
MAGFSRSLAIGLSGLALAGCGAPASPEDYESEEELIAETQEPATTTLPVAARYLKGSSTTPKFHGAGAQYISCAGYPLVVSYDYQNTGSVVLRDVEGKGSTKGSDVKLVTTSGKKDSVTKKKFKSVRDNGNGWVRSDRKAANCLDKDGCRNTRFKMKGVAPTKPGLYTSRWRLRDFSAAWDGTSKPFGPIAKLRFNVVPCNSVDCGCTAHCTDGSSFKTAAEASNCEEIATAKCNDELLSWNYEPCPWDPPPVGSGGSSGGGSGGTSSGGTSSGGTSSGGSSGSSSGGCSSCVLDEEYEGGESCCTASNTCGFTADYLQGKCVPLPDEGVLDENGYTPGPDYPQDPGDPTDPNDPNYDPDSEDYIDPSEVEESRGGVTAAEGGCSVSSRPSRSAAWLAGLLGIALLARRRRA